MASKIDWDAGHTPATGTVNAAMAAAAVAGVGHETGLPASWVLGAAGFGAVGSYVSGTWGDNELSNNALGLRAAAWLAGGGWASVAINDPWSAGSFGSLACLTCLFGAAAGAMSARRRKKEARDNEARAALFRVKLAADWEDRFARVCNISGCQVINIEKYPKDTGYMLEVKLPGNGATWRSIQQFCDQLASDLDLPAGCGVEVTPGVTRGVCIVKVSTVNALSEVIDLPRDASPLNFEEDFDIGVHRDRALAMVNMRQNSGMMAGDKRSGKTNQLQTFISRFVRMPNLLVWVIDFNGGGVALPWLQAWDELGRKGRPPIDWVASNEQEAEAMVNAAVKIATKRKTAYQKMMRKANTDLLPMTPEVPGIMIITDEGAEILGNPRRRFIADPYKEVLRIAGAVGVNELSCFLRATADVTGDPIIKSQSRMRVGMRMADSDEIAYLLGWKSGVSPEDMPDRGYGAVTMDPSKSAAIFKGYRVLPDDIDWMVEHTAALRPELDKVSADAAGELYATRWADDRCRHLFDGSDGPDSELVGSAPEAKEGTEEAPWAGRPQVTAEQSSDNLRKAIEDAGDPEPDEFQRVLEQAGVADPNDPSTWPDGQRPEVSDSEDEEATDDLRAVVFGLVKAMSPRGIGVADIRARLAEVYGEDNVPSRQSITKWLREDDRVYKPTGYGVYAVKPEHM